MKHLGRRGERAAAFAAARWVVLHPPRASGEALLPIRRRGPKLKHRGAARRKLFHELGLSGSGQFLSGAVRVSVSEPDAA